MPSAADRAITARLKQVLALVDVRVIDHIVVGASCQLGSSGPGLIHCLHSSTIETVIPEVG